MRGKEKLLEKLDEDEDVMNVYHNMEEPEDDWLVESGRLKVLVSHFQPSTFN